MALFPLPMFIIASRRGRKAHLLTVCKHPSIELAFRLSPTLLHKP